jgi:hypothetical protein
MFVWKLCHIVKYREKRGKLESDTGISMGSHRRGGGAWKSMTSLIVCNYSKLIFIKLR